jgi:IMP dehydrogenase/GMP reductase
MNMNNNEMERLIVIEKNAQSVIETIETDKVKLSELYKKKMDEYDQDLEIQIRNKIEGLRKKMQIDNQKKIDLLDQRGKEQMQVINTVFNEQLEQRVSDIVERILK